MTGSAMPANLPYIGGLPILSISLYGGGGGDASQKSWNLSIDIEVGKFSFGI